MKVSVRRQLLPLALLLWSTIAAALEARLIEAADGTPLQVIETGPVDAPGILFIHGFGLSSSSWLQQFRSALSERYRLVALDLRGHGNSGKPMRAEGYAESALWAGDVATVIRETGLTKPVIVAWSYGGHVTMDYLRHYPADSLAGIVFVGTSGGMLPFPMPDESTAKEFARLGALAMSADAAERLEAARGFYDGMSQGEVPAAARERDVAAILAIPPYARRLMQSRALDNSDLVTRLTLPVLFLLGDAERTAKPADIGALAAQIPAANVMVYPATGHMPFIEREARFNEDIDAFAAAALRAPPGN